MMHVATTVFQFVKLECLIQPIIIQDDADKYYDIENDITTLLDFSNVSVDTSDDDVSAVVINLNEEMQETTR